MSSYTVKAGERGVHEKVLAAATVDTVTFESDLDRVEVASHDGAAPIYFTVDGTAPTVAGSNCFVVLAAMGALSVDAPAQAGTVVKLISSGTPRYSVTADAK